MSDSTGGQGFISTIIYAVAAVEAVLAVLGWVWKPRRKKIERALSVLALVLAITGAATAQYTTTALIIMGSTLALLLVVFVLKSSLIAYLEFDKHVTQAYVLFDSARKEELSELARTAFRPKGIPATKTAQGLEDIARRGEQAANAPDILEAAGTVSVALGTDFRLCTDLLISLKRYFDFEGSYMDVADKMAVSAMNGVQPVGIRQALSALQKERAAGPPLKLEEFLAALMTLGRKDQDPELSGEALGAIINELMHPSATSNNVNSVRDYAQQMLRVVDLIDEANIGLTARSMELQTEITQRALQGETFLPTGDPLLSALGEALKSAKNSLDEATRIASSATPPKRLSTVHGDLIESLQTQLVGTEMAQRGVEVCDFAAMTEGLKRKGRGVDGLTKCAQALRKTSRGLRRNG